MLRPYDYYDFFTPPSTKPRIKHTNTSGFQWEVHYRDMRDKAHWAYFREWGAALRYVLRVLGSLDE